MLEFISQLQIRGKFDFKRMKNAQNSTYQCSCAQSWIVSTQYMPTNITAWLAYNYGQILRLGFVLCVRVRRKNPWPDVARPGFR